MCFDLGENITPPGDGWRAWLDPARTPRQQALLAIWGVLRKLGDTERETLMAGIRRELTTSPMEAGSGRPTTSEEVRALVPLHSDYDSLAEGGLGAASSG